MKGLPPLALVPVILALWVIPFWVAYKVNECQLHWANIAPASWGPIQGCKAQGLKAS